MYFGETPKIEYESKVIGVLWNILTDELVFDMKKCFMEITNENLISRRTVLKVLPSVYDPLGILSPAVCICVLKLDWDVPLPSLLKNGKN